MPSPFSVTTPTDEAATSHREDERVTVGEVTFTIHNDTDRDDRAMVEVVPISGAPGAPLEPEGAWFEVERTTVPLPAGSADQVRVSIRAPHGTTPGRYGFRIRTYSASGVPEETVAVGPMVTFTVEEATAHGTPPWLWAAVAAAVVAVVAVLAVLLWPSDDDPATELAVDITGGEPVVSYTVTCGGDPALEPEVDGLDAVRACQRLEDQAAVQLLVEGPDPGRTCLQVAGGPQVATITGTVDDQPVDARLARGNSCEQGDWDRVLDGVLPSVDDRGGAVLEEEVQEAEQVEEVEQVEPPEVEESPATPGDG